MTVSPRVVRWVQEGSVYVLLLMLSFSKASIEICFGVLFATWILERVHPATRGDTLWSRPQHRFLLGALGAFLAACVISIVLSDFPGKSLHGFVGKWLEYSLFFIIMADIASRPWVTRRALWVIAASTLLVVLEGVSQEWHGRGLLRGYPLLTYGRMTGPYENPLDLATYLMVMLPLMLGWAVTGRRTRLMGGVVVVLAGACLIRTLALGAWGGVALAVSVMLALGGRPLRRMLLVFSIVALIVVGALLGRSGHLREMVSPVEVGKRDRIVMWQAAVGMIKDRPVFGHGVNTFMANYLRYWVGGERQPRYAHNCYLQVAAETGLVGLAAFLTWLAALFMHLISACLRGAPALLIGLSAGLVAFVAQAAIDTNFYAMREAALFWVLAGIGVGITEQLNLSSRQGHDRAIA